LEPVDTVRGVDAPEIPPGAALRGVLAVIVFIPVFFGLVYLVQVIEDYRAGPLPKETPAAHRTGNPASGRRRLLPRPRSHPRRVRAEPDPLLRPDQAVALHSARRPRSVVHDRYGRPVLHRNRGRRRIRLAGRAP
jgi:hypothetical protein